MLKKIAVIVATLAVSAPAFADRDHHRGHHWGGHGHRQVVHHKHVQHRPVVQHYHYRPAPQPVVVHHYYRPAPRPVYVVQRRDSVVPALLVGTIIGAAIVHHAATAHYGY